MLGALSPSRAGDFMTCPLLYRFRTIDRLPEAPSPDAVRGTLVHKVLEDLFDLPAAERTPEQARRLLVPAWDALLEAEPELAEMFAGRPTARRSTLGPWLAVCREVLDRYFTLEDPRRLEPAERELYVEALLDSGLLLRGFVDRLDVAPDGAIRVVDYKTGRAPGRGVRGQGAVPDEVLRAGPLAHAAAWCRRCCSWSTSATARCSATSPTRTTCWPPSARSRRSGGRSAGRRGRRLAPQQAALCAWCAHQAICPESAALPHRSPWSVPSRSPTPGSRPRTSTR